MYPQGQLCFKTPFHAKDVTLQLFDKNTVQVSYIILVKPQPCSIGNL